MSELELDEARLELAYKAFDRAESYYAGVRAAILAYISSGPERAAGEMREALTEVRDWIRNWSPDFEQDEAWPETAAKMRAALWLANRQPALNAALAAAQPEGGKS